MKDLFGIFLYAVAVICGLVVPLYIGASALTIIANEFVTLNEWVEYFYVDEEEYWEDLQLSEGDDPSSREIAQMKSDPTLEELARRVWELEQRMAIARHEHGLLQADHYTIIFNRNRGEKELKSRRWK